MRRGFLARIAFYVLLGNVAAAIHSCSGAVSGPPPTPEAPGPLLISPSMATVYSGLETTFLVTGGTPPYIVTSTDQAIVPVQPTINGGAFTIRPRNVFVDTPVALGIMDSGTAVPIAASLTVKPIATAPLSAKPETISFQGIEAGKCASVEMKADVIVSGGTPPYTVAQPVDFSVSAVEPVGRVFKFTITSMGRCSTASQIAVVDSVGASVAVTVSNVLSAAVDQPQPFAVAPAAVTLTSCTETDTAMIAVIGGRVGNYFAVSGNHAVRADIAPDNRVGFISRRAGVPVGPESVLVAFSDGRETRDVTVTLGPVAQGPCS